MDAFTPHRIDGDHVARTSLRAGTCDDRTDDELIALIAAGESAAFEALYNRYSNPK
jgi:hypothetical protein